MQQIALFRKLVINNKSYYQLYDIKTKEVLNEEIGDFTEHDKKDYFYININDDQAKVFNQNKYLIFELSNNELNLVLNDKELNAAFKEFKEHFNDMNDLELDIEFENELDLIYNSIKESVLFQDDAIIELLKIIKRNQDILNSDIQENVKNTMKDNIILAGLPSSGKKTIFKALQDNLDIPYAEVSLTPDFETNISRIYTQLIKTANGDLEKASHGIIYIKDNFDELANYNENLMTNPYIPLLTLMNGVKLSLSIKDEKKEFDFNKLTFIIEMNISSYNEIEDYMLEISDIPNNYLVMTQELTPKQQKIILLKSNNSVINTYKNLLKKLNKKLIIQKGFLDELILVSKNINGGMQFINDVISKMIKLDWYSNEKVVYLTIPKLRNTLQYFDEDMDKIENISEVLEDNVSKNSTADELDYNLEQLVNIIKENVCSQDEHVKRILYTLLRNRRAANSKDLENPKRYIKNILIRGESGSGKTLILTEISKLLKLPIFIADATSYTEEGYIGNSVTDMLVSLYKAANNDLEKAQRGILVIDEIDKKSGHNADSNVSRGAVLDGLLKIIEGAVIPVELGRGMNSKKIMFDTSRLTVICSGAFENIEQIREQRLGIKKTLGFGSTTQINPDQDPKIIDEDYVKYGMNRQFMARLGVIVNLNKLEKDDLKNIMKNSKTSELVIQKKLSQLEGVELVYEDSFYDALKEKAYNKKIGARGIEKAFNEVLDNIKFMDIDTTKYSKIIFNDECVKDPTKIILIEKENDKKLLKTR